METERVGHTGLLEVLEQSQGKKYVDGVVEESPGNYVAIELKYTLKQKNFVYNIGGCPIFTFAQGNDDERKYAFLSDVQRIEKLVELESDAFGIPKAKIVKGFSIIMSNDNYWDTIGEGTNYRDVTLYEGRSVPSNSDLYLYSKKKPKGKPIILKNTYECHWHNYALTDTTVSYTTDKGNSKTVDYSKYPFKYMIFEIKG